MPDEPARSGSRDTEPEAPATAGPRLVPPSRRIEPVPGRFGETVRRHHDGDDPEGCVFALIGMPDDTGVRLNNGRPGAAEGPTELRSALARAGVSAPPGWDWPGLWDAGDVEVARDNQPGDLRETHRRVREASAWVASQGLAPIGVGGGHDLTFPLVAGVLDAIRARGDETRRASLALDGVYFDPHLDVRDEDGSGMPFRRLIESGVARSLRLHGFEPTANSREHFQWFLNHGGRIDDASSPTDPWPEGPTFASFDLDVLDAAHAPGVSAANPAGWSPGEAIAWVRAAGAEARAGRLVCFDIMELAPGLEPELEPEFDAETQRGVERASPGVNRTARLAARLLLEFLRGYADPC